LQPFSARTSDKLGPGVFLLSATKNGDESVVGLNRHTANSQELQGRRKFGMQLVAAAGTACDQQNELMLTAQASNQRLPGTASRPKLGTKSRFLVPGMGKFIQ